MRGKIFFHLNIRLRDEINEEERDFSEMNENNV